MSRVLIADDTKNIRLMLARYFEMEGYTVSLADNGNSALELLYSKPFDLILLDIKMPEISGTQVLRMIRERGIQTPVIVMTAYGTIKNAVETTNLGARAYLQKPFTVEKLRKLLEDMKQQNILITPEEQLAQLERAMEQGNILESLERLKSHLSQTPLEPEIYRLLSKGSGMLEDQVAAEQYSALFETLQKNKKRRSDL